MEEELSYCMRNITQNDRPGHTEIIAPPIILALVLFFGQLSLYLMEQYRCYQRRKKWSQLCDPWLSTEQTDGNGTQDVVTCLLGDRIFYTPFDLEVLDNMNSSFNRFGEIIKITMPCFCAVLLSTIIVLGGDPIFACIWPYRTKPDINTGVTCFLAPAGLVFALSFGFVFQMVLEKHSAVKDKITVELSMLDQMITMTTKFDWPRQDLLMGMLKAIKTELVTTSLLIQNRESSTFRNKAPPEYRVQIWAILDLLFHACEHPEPRFNVNSILVEKYVTYLLSLNSICTDRMGAMHLTIHPMKWIFLEFLASVSVFGVMMVYASSSLMELALCELTVFSVFMLFYVLADFDSPFNGFFRVDVSLIPEIVERAERLYQEATDKQQVETKRRHSVMYENLEAVNDIEWVKAKTAVDKRLLVHDTESFFGLHNRRDFAKSQDTDSGFGDKRSPSSDVSGVSSASDRQVRSRSSDRQTGSSENSGLMSGGASVMTTATFLTNLPGRKIYSNLRLDNSERSTSVDPGNDIRLQAMNTRTGTSFI